MRRRIGIYGAIDETLQLIPLLVSNPKVEIAALFDPDPERAEESLRATLPDRAEDLSGLLTGDFGAFVRVPLDAIIDGGIEPDLSTRLPESSAEFLSRDTTVRRLTVKCSQASPDNPCRPVFNFASDR